MQDKDYMEIALDQAKKAYQVDEVPVGAIIVLKDEIIAKAYNQRETKQSTLSHAEIEVIRIANEKLGSWRLDECTLYVTLEPCMMCTGAIQQARIKKVIYATNDENNGYLNQLTNQIGLNHYPEIIGGVLEVQSKKLIKDYFIEKRSLKVRIKEVKEENLKKYYELREEVFVEEQKVSLIEEYDEYDAEDNDDVKHIVAMKNQQVIGTMRLIFQRKESVLKVGRLAIKQSYRKQGIGKQLLDYANLQAINNGLNCLELGAQISAKGFYESNMYTARGPIFLDAGIEHISMVKNIKK